jgi:hypothetical protein
MQLEARSKPWVLIGSGASLQRIREALDEINNLTENDTIRPGDTIVVLAETYFLHEGKDAYLAAADTNMENLGASALSTREVSERLGRLAALDIRVMLLLDLEFQPDPNNRLPPSYLAWIQDLYLNRGIIVGTRRFYYRREAMRSKGHGFVAQALIDSLRPRPSREKQGSLDDMQDGLFQRIQDLSGGELDYVLHFPRTMSPRRTRPVPPALRSAQEKKRARPDEGATGGKLR